MRATLTKALQPWLGLLLVLGGFSLHPDFTRVFWTPSYLQTVLQQAATNIIAAVGMTFVIVTGGIDLSIGAVMALSGIALGMGVQQGLPPFICVIMALPLGIAVAALLDKSGVLRGGARTSLLAGAAVLATIGIAIAFKSGFAGGIRLEWAILAALLTGAGCGIANGLAITIGRVPPFVATLGMLTIARGLTLYATDGNSVSNLPERLGNIGQGTPIMIVALAVAVLGGVLLTRTKTGRYWLAIGGNEEAARLSGLPVGAYKGFAYTVCGICAAMAAIVLTAKFRLADTNAGTNAELNAIAAVVIGGASLSGGRGTISGTLAGALTIAVLNTGLVLIRVPSTLQGVVIGSVIVATVMLDQLRSRQRRRM